jgi:hypothetical protein
MDVVVDNFVIETSTSSQNRHTFSESLPAERRKPIESFGSPDRSA